MKVREDTRPRRQQGKRSVRKAFCTEMRTSQQGRGSENSYSPYHSRVLFPSMRFSGWHRLPRPLGPSLELKCKLVETSEASGLMVKAYQNESNMERHSNLLLIKK